MRWQIGWGKRETDNNEELYCCLLQEGTMGRSLRISSWKWPSSLILKRKMSFHLLSLCSQDTIQIRTWTIYSRNCHLLNTVLHTEDWMWKASGCFWKVKDQLSQRKWNSLTEYEPFHNVILVPYSPCTLWVPLDMGLTKISPCTPPNTGMEHIILSPLTFLCFLKRFDRSYSLKQSQPEWPTSSKCQDKAQLCLNSSAAYGFRLNATAEL